MPPRTQLAAVLGAGVLAISLAAIFIRLADAPALVVAGYRMAVAALLILPLGLGALRQARAAPRALGFSALAGLSLAAHFATWISSLEYTSVTASVALVATQPLWVALFAWFFLGSAPSFLVLLGTLLATVGGALIGFGDFGPSSRSLLGDALALAGAAFAAGYLLLGRSAQRRGLDLQAHVGLAYLVAALALLPLPALAGLPYFSYSPATFGWIVLLALLPQLVGHTSLNYAMKHLPPTTVATAMLLEPVGASLFALLLFGELPGRTILFGAALLLAGVLLSVQGSRSETLD